MMDIRFVTPELRQLDALKCEALAVPFFEDERPLQGVLGLIDWRACGMISRLIVARRIQGTPQETVLIPARPKLGVEKLFLFGMGQRASFGEPVLRTSIRHMLTTLSAARVRASALVMPGRALELVEPVRAMEVFLECGSSHPEHDEVILVESSEGQRAMAPVVERERRRARAFLAG